MDPEKVTNFQFVKNLLVEKMEVMIFKVFIHQSWKQKYLHFSFSLNQAYGKADDDNTLEMSTQSAVLRSIFEINSEGKLYSTFIEIKT